MSLHRSAAGRAGSTWSTSCPGDAGWAYSGLRVLVLEPGSRRVFETGDSEVFVLPLRGSLDVEVRADALPDVVEARYGLEGRDSVFTRVTDFAYVGRDSTVHAAQRGRSRGGGALSPVHAAARPPRYGAGRARCRSRCAAPVRRPGR